MSSVTAPCVSPSAMRISAKPRKFVATSWCSSSSRANTNSRIFLADCLSPPSKSSRAPGRRLSAPGAVCGSALYPEIIVSSVPSFAAHAISYGTRGEESETVGSFCNVAMRSAAWLYCFVATRYFTQRSCQLHQTARAFSCCNPSALAVAACIASRMRW